MATADQASGLRTPLHTLHVELGAKMVLFAGYDMPVQFPGGIIQEHRHTRDQVGLFDVSHMGQILIRGQNAAESLERVVPLDVTSMANNHQAYTVLTNDQGGILDDLIVTRWSADGFFLVVNAARKAQDRKSVV